MMTGTRTVVDELKALIVRIVAGLEDDAYSRFCIRAEIDPELGWVRPDERAEHLSTRLAEKSRSETVRFARFLLQDCPDNPWLIHQLKEAMRLVETNGKRLLSRTVRQRILDEVAGGGWRIAFDEFAARVWPTAHMPTVDYRFSDFAGCIWQHMLMNSDWSLQELWNYLDVDSASDELFVELIEQFVHPLVRSEEHQVRLVERINKHLQACNGRLVVVDESTVGPIYGFRRFDVGVEGTPKNIIFAAVGPKPEIVLHDAISNEIRIVKNEENCLIFDRPIPGAGLRWGDLVEWWADKTQQSEQAAETTLLKRLQDSVPSESPPEQNFFSSYYGRFRRSDCPALLPQVYLHYDPYSLKDVGVRRLQRQRMDFVMLLEGGRRVIFEVDGRQHYSEQNGAASPRKYAEMMAEDRRLRLLGYEVYRFGGSELQSSSVGIVSEFFDAFFRKHATNVA